MEDVLLNQPKVLDYFGRNWLSRPSLLGAPAVISPHIKLLSSTHRGLSFFPLLMLLMHNGHSSIPALATRKADT